MKWLLAVVFLLVLTTLVSVWATRHGSGVPGVGGGNYTCHETTMVNREGQIRGTLTICGYGLIRSCETLEGERC